MVSSVNSHIIATSKRWHLLEIGLRFALSSTLWWVEGAHRGLSRERSDYRGASLIRNSAPLGPCSRTMPRAQWRPWGAWLFLMSEVPGYFGLACLAREHPRLARLARERGEHPWSAHQSRDHRAMRG